ncbi:xanthine dehydrogenase family protein molybdopterin-binding subunit [Falsirhodobacter xinxiangensis]|uniref:xanthine dehydrogenase family protein molybdopterin-binding subunit n=1 Tax=Falsirhodobacter xinxiangensis TaxID=2530049 RepID=UPI0010A99F2B|nr:xanthine dehydrogenase family protein molybdopterin-binding subunit [Rhodobacter xinxiangensis]
MTRHRKIDHPDNDNRLDSMAQGVLGKPVDRLEGPLKVSGLATYASEARPSGMAHGVLVRATITKGRVVGIDRQAALALPGVMTVITDPRMVRYPAQGMAGKGPKAGPDVVDYHGQPIALVVAEGFEQARHAAKALRITYEEEPAPTDPDTVTPEVPDAKQKAQGDLDAAIRDAAFSVDCTYTTPTLMAVAMEPHAAIAEWDGDRVTVRAALQMLASDRKQLADALGVGPEQVRLLAPYVGGGFGSKLGIAPEAVAAAIAAKELGVPVSVALTRMQEFDITHRRSESRQRVLLAAGADGVLTGIGHEALVSNLPDSPFSEPVTQATPFTYQAAHRRIAHRIARVHRSCAGSVRAPGEAIGVTVFEAALDELAEAAGIDPVELRLRNIPDREPGTGRPYSVNRLGDCLREGAHRFGWNQRRAPKERLEGEWFIGMGMAAAVRVNMLIESRARVTLTEDGAKVETDMTDIGTGTYTILRQIAAEMLGLPVDLVEVHLGDTDFPPAAGSGGSFGAASSGTSVYLACEDIRARIAERMGCTDAELRLQDGRASFRNDTRELRELLAGEVLVAEGHVEPGDAEKQARQATWGAHFAEVAVSRHTGEVRVRRMLGVFACGRILNEKTARSQCLGGMTFGIGMALTEGVEHDPRTGHIVNRDLAGYHLPSHADVPEQDVVFLPDRDGFAGPMQAKGIGELGICGAGGAVLNAIYNACGVRVRDLPATPDKVMP